MNGPNLLQNRVRKRRGLGPKSDVLTTCKAVTLRGSQRVIGVFPTLMHLSMLCRQGGGGGGRAWGGDLMVFVGPGEGHLTDLVLPGEGIFESFFARREDIWLPTRTKKTETEHMFPASTLHACAVRFEKIRKSWRPMRTSEGWVDFTVLSSNVVCFSVFLINWISLTYCGIKLETKSIFASTIDQCMAHSLQSL